MRCLISTFLVGLCLMIRLGSCFAQAKASRVYFLQDMQNQQWCAFRNRNTWSHEVQHIGAMVVGTFTYSDNRLSHIDVTATDESGDWTVYDHYRVDDRGQIVKLSRTINVLPGDRSVVQTFSISHGKANKERVTQKELSTGKILTSAKPTWLPDLPIDTDIKTLPFSGLLRPASSGTIDKECVSAAGSRTR